MICPSCHRPARHVRSADTFLTGGALERVPSWRSWRLKGQLRGRDITIDWLRCRTGGGTAADATGIAPDREREVLGRCKYLERHPFAAFNAPGALHLHKES